MPEFVFYGDCDDTANLLRSIFALGPYHAVANRNYETRSFDRFSKLEGCLLKALDVNKLIYITGSFTLGEIGFSEIMGGKYKGTFVITPSKGAEVLEIRFPVISIEADQKVLNPGLLSYPEYFWDLKTGSERRPSDELKRSYRELKALFKRCMTKHKIAGDSVWIATSAYNRLKSQQVLILSSDKLYDKKAVR